MPLIGFTLEAIGFVANQAQSPETLQSMKIFFLAGPGALIFAGIFVAMLFKITPHTHGVLTAELDRLKKGGSKADATPEVKQVCEELTGIAYEELYPKKA